MFKGITMNGSVWICLLSIIIAVGDCDRKIDNNSSIENVDENDVDVDTITEPNNPRCDAEWIDKRCRLIDPKYFYDSDRKQCIRIISGDCEGNVHLFNDIHSCAQECMQVQH